MTQPPTVHRGRSGISIVEILITIVVLAVGALAALGLQVSALRASGTAESVQILTRVAESELQFRRGVDLGGAALADAGSCRVFVPDSLTCAVVVTPCTLVAGALSCSGIAAASATAHQVQVTTADARGGEVVLTSLVATTAGTASGGDDGEGSDDGDQAGTPPTEPDPELEPDPDPGNGSSGGGNGNGNGGGGNGNGDPVACVPRGNSGNCH